MIIERDRNKYEHPHSMRPQFTPYKCLFLHIPPSSARFFSSFLTLRSSHYVTNRMTSNRSHFRNVHFYDGTKDGDDDDALGGLIRNGSVTEGNFLDMLGILLVTESPIRVHHGDSDHIVSRTDDQLEVGIYDVYCDSDIKYWMNDGYIESFHTM